MAARGYCLIELLFVSALSAVLAAIAVPQFLVSLDDHRARGAARYVSTHCARARIEGNSTHKGRILRKTVRLA